MVQSIQSPVTFNEFINWLPESAGYRYELHRGAIVEMPKPRGKHSLVAGFIAKTLHNAIDSTAIDSTVIGSAAIDSTQLPYVIPRECIVRSADGLSGYEPDVIVLDEPALIDEPEWESGSILTLGKSIKLVVEVVSTNWQDDYLTKLRDYEALGILEYWIADYAGLGGRQFIGKPKQPTFSVYVLLDGEYEVQRFRAGDRLISPTFPALNLMADQVFAIGG